MLRTHSENKSIKQFYLKHLSNLGPLLCRVLWLNEQLLQQWLFVKLTHQLTLQMLFHKVHQEVHHCLGHTVDTQLETKLENPHQQQQLRSSIDKAEEIVSVVLPPLQVIWTSSRRTCLGCFYGQWGSSSWWGAEWPHSPSAPSHSACGIRAPPGKEVKS